MQLSVNGAIVQTTAAPETPLLYILRNDCRLNGPKYGCGLGECGACTVLINNEAVRSCVVPVSRVANCSIVTLEGLGEAPDYHPVQKAFIECQAAQCGYCLNGMIIETVALLDRLPNPTQDQICEALHYNLCRCGAHYEILNAVKLASDLLQSRGG